MKRTGFKNRGQPLKRSKFRTGTAAPKRHARINACNRKRRSKLWARQFHSIDFVNWTKAQPCCVCGERGPNHASHSAKSRGAGGTYKDVVSLCESCHSIEHGVGSRTFWQAQGRSARVEAVEHWRRFLSWREW